MSQMNRVIEHSLNSFEEEQEQIYNSAVDDSRAIASEDLIEDVAIELTGLHGNPWTRLRLLAVIGLDDLQANTSADTQEGEDLKERLKVIKGYMEGFIYSDMDPARDPAYEDAMGYIENAEEKDLTVYSAVLPLHIDMCMAEEEERLQLIAAEQATLAEAMRAEKQAEIDKKVVAITQKEDARQARLRYYTQSK